MPENRGQLDMAHVRRELAAANRILLPFGISRSVRLRATVNASSSGASWR